MRKFTEEFKKTAVSEILASGKRPEEIAKDLGCSVASLAVWKRALGPSVAANMVRAGATSKKPEITQSHSTINSEEYNKLLIRVEVYREIIQLLLTKINI